MFASFPQLSNFSRKACQKKLIKRTSLTSKPYWSQTPISEVLELKKKKKIYLLTFQKNQSSHFKKVANKNIWSK